MSLPFLCCALLISHSRLFAAPQIVARQVPLSMGILQARLLDWVCHALLEGIVPNLGLNPGLPNCRWILYHLSHQGNPLKF